MSRDPLRAEARTLAELFANGARFVVPPFQRDYAWGGEQWDELWQDVVAIASGDNSASTHFLGPIVLQDLPGRGRERLVIDGQQRLVTLSVLALAVISRVEVMAEQKGTPDNKDDLERVRLLRERHISTLDPVSLRLRPRLTLNRRDDSFYATRLVDNELPMARPRHDGERRLFDAWYFFRRQVDAKFGPDTTSEALADFLTRVQDGLQFIEIHVEDDDTAFVVFETLNARGMALSTADLVKNYLFSKAARYGEHDLDLARAGWERVIREVPSEAVSRLLFCGLAGGAQSLTEKRVYGEVKRLVPDPDDVVPFLRQLEESARLYAALDAPEAELWSDLPSPPRAAVKLLQLLEAEDARPLLLAAWRVVSPEDFGKLLHQLSVLLLRAQIARVNTGETKRAFIEAANRITNEQLKRPAKILRALRGIYPSDDDFGAAFEKLSVDPQGRHKRLARYLLAALERKMGGAPVSEDDPQVTVEHILPVNPGGLWPDFSAEQHRQDLTRLGNLTLLEYRLNKQVGSAGFTKKAEVYAQSHYVMTRNIEGEGWSPEAIRARQKVMAEHAVQIWRLDLSGE